MDDGLVESVKKTLMDRINTPLFGFIFLSWIVFNWDNILFVLLSEVSIENRINAIKLANDFYFRGFIGPVLSGFILSIAFPYLQWIVSYFQRKSQKLIDDNKKQREIDECSVIKELAKERAEAAAAIEFEKAKNALALANKKMEAEMVENDIDVLTQDYKTTLNNINIAREQLSQLDQSLEQKREIERSTEARVATLEKRTRHANEVIKSREEQRILKNGILKSIGDIESVTNILRDEIANARGETNEYPKTNKIGVKEYFSLDALGLLRLTGDIFEGINHIDDSIAEVRAVLEGKDKANI
ncbi:Uncharacterised protein [Serratia fonticola]|nr:Uncharacterised protein [Serratia fonticola]